MFLTSPLIEQAIALIDPAEFKVPAPTLNLSSEAELAPGRKRESGLEAIGARDGIFRIGKMFTVSRNPDNPETEELYAYNRGI